MDTLDQWEGRNKEKLDFQKSSKMVIFLVYDFDFVFWLEANSFATNQKTERTIQTGMQKSLFGSLVSKIGAPTQCPTV